MRSILATAWHSKARLSKVVKPNVDLTKAIVSEITSTSTSNYFPLDSVKAGEDALFHSRHAASGQIAFGVADGVGGWTESGVDPSLFSRMLLKNISSNINSTEAEQWSELNPLKLLQASHQRIIDEGDPEYGGSTATIGTFDPTSGALSVLQLGDSTFALFGRRSELTFASEEQTHGFNFPYQLTALPAAQLQAMAGRLDKPQDGLQRQIQLQPDDIILIGTDGVFDNLYTDDILSVIREQLSDNRVAEVLKQHQQAVASGSSSSAVVAEAPGSLNAETVDQLETQCLANVARSINDLAVHRSLLTRYMSPFAKRAKEARLQFNSGKIDDVSLVMLWWQPQMFAKFLPQSKL
ncbi:Protein phosphatase 2C 7 [Dimargaris cristalligena]|nr:Protein phosphatase 2C 7 [Dimargaris cristalligena]